MLNQPEICCVLPAKCAMRNTGVNLSVKALLLLLLLFLKSRIVLGRSSGIRTCLVGDFSPPMFKKKLIIGIMKFQGTG